MKTRDFRKRLPALAMTLILALASSGFAKGQSGSASTRPAKSAPVQKVQIEDDLAKALEAALVELQHLRTVRKLSAEQIDALNQKVGALEDLVKIERERAEAYKAADSERAKANTLDDQRIAIYDKMVADYKSERDRLMKERDSARRNGKLYAVGGFVLGVLAAIFAKSGN